MKKRCFHLIAAALLGVALAGTASLPASADGWGHGHYRGWHHGHSSFALGLNFVWPFYRYPPDYYYAPPPRVVYVQPPPVCRQFDGDATIDATGGPFYGTACLEADGLWHIVN